MSLVKTYLVGGAVRDELLGIEVKDRDWVVVGATPEEMLAKGYQQVGADFPVFLHPTTREEYALARTERKSGQGYGGFVCDFSPSISLEDDLYRRDLTINAIAKASDGQLIDPYGGRKDLEQRRLRHVSDAFIEDPLRVLRVARFASRYADRGFRVAAETLSLMQEIARSGELQALTAERCWKEISRALMQPTPSVFFDVLRQATALRDILPEVDQLFGVPQPAKHHPEIDTGVHTMMALDWAASRHTTLEVRTAVLLHDLGKGLTDASDWPHHHGHEDSGLPLITQVCSRLKVPKQCRDLALLTARFHTHCHRALDLKPSTLLKVLNHCDVWRRPDRFDHFLLACKADAKGRKGFANREYPQSDYLKGAYHAAAAVEARTLVAEGYQGKALAEQLHQHRVSAIAKFRQKWNSQPSGVSVS